MVPAERRLHAVQFIGGLALCFGISFAWGSVAVLLYGHRGNNGTLTVLLACMPIIQIAAVALLWRKFRFVALGGVSYIVGEVVFVPAAWLGLLWLR